MTTRDTIITKLHNLPESLLQQVNDFIDLVALTQQSKIVNGSSPEDICEAWKQWFEGVDRLDDISSQATSEYQELLLDKYRQQGLEL